MSKNLTSFQKSVSDLRDQGKCSVEIAEILGRNRKQVIQTAKTIGKPFSDEERARSIELGKINAKKSQYGTVEDRIRHQNDFIEKYHSGFEVIDGWISNDGVVKIRCKTCGSVFDRSATMVRRKNKTILCHVCEEKKKFEKQEWIELEKIKKQEKREEEKKFAIFKKEFQQMAFKQCKCCGSLFLGKNKCYCSDKCAKKVFNSIGKDKRIKKKKAVIIDRGITLEKLYERDNGICWLCGCQCDWHDYEITPGGAFVVGKNYPSEDHVIPLSKGGIHSWNNVKLAHHYCNSIKSNKVVSL